MEPVGLLRSPSSPISIYVGIFAFSSAGPSARISRWSCRRCAQSDARFFRRESIETAIDRLNRELVEFRQALDRFVTDYKVELAKVMLISIACWLFTALVLQCCYGASATVGGAARDGGHCHLLPGCCSRPLGSSGAAELGFAASSPSLRGQCLACSSWCGE